MADDRRPAYNISLNKALKQGGFYGTNGVWNSLVKVDGRVLRGRVEVLVLKKDQQQIFMHIKSYNKKKYRVPGGSYEKDVPNYIQAQNEVNEEARIKVKGLVNSGEHYINLYKDPKPLYGSSFMWVGNYTEVYVGEYDGKYTGHVADEDKDEDIYNKGKFYNISEVYPILNDTHKRIIDSIFPSLNKGSINENTIILRESNSKPHYFPYYTPYEMSKLGVFNEVCNKYSDIEDEAIEWYLEYTDSLRNPDSENWLKELKYRYDNYIKESTDENKQLILNLGWNPEIPVTIENVLIASRKTKERLNESTDEKLVLDEGLIFSSKDIVRNIDDFESGKSNILFITGLAGSGKTTLAGTLEEQYGAEVISLDYFQHETSFYRGEFKDSASYKVVEKYMKENPDVEKDRYSFNDIGLDKFKEYFVPFFGWLVNTLKKDKNKKYIVEGIHILLFIPYKDIKGYPLYCVNTSAIKSLVRHWKRDDWNVEDIMKHGYGDIMKFKDWNNQYNRFKDSMKENYIESPLTEATIYDPFSDVEVKSPFTPNDFIYTADMINRKLDTYHNKEGKYTCIQPIFDCEWDNGAVVFAQYIISKKDDEVDVINFINEMNNWINNSILVGEVEMPAYIKDEGFLILKDVKGFLGESAVLQESESGKYYRVTYNGVGIYQALKERTTQEQWKLLLQDPAITWLPKPPEYAEGMISYFTKYGYKMFEMYTYPLIEKYFDEDILVVPLRSLDEDIIYKDKYQVVVNTSLNEITIIEETSKTGIIKSGEMYSIIYNNGECLEEGYVKNMEDIYYNKEKFDSGEINLCFITGLSGSGKSTMARGMAKDTVEHYELDDVIANKVNFTMQNFKDYGDLIYSFFNGVGKKYFVTAEDTKKDKSLVTWKDYDKELITDFVEHSMKYANSHKSRRFIVEGIWLFKYVQPAKLDKYAVYIKGTSGLVSMVRAMKRDYNRDKNEGIKFNQRISWIMNRLFHDIQRMGEFESKIQNYRNYFSKMSTNESVTNNDKEYGLPQLKKYPMPDEKHVLSAIRFFNYVSPANEEELAMNIKKKMKQYDIPPSKVGDKNRLKKYLKEDTDIVQEIYYDNLDSKPVLVFDIGSVLVDSKVSYLDSLYKSRLIPDNLAQEIHDYIMDTYKDNSEYLAYCTTREYCNFMIDKAPKDLKKYIPAAIKINTDSLKKLPYTDSLLKRLKDKGYTLFYLSNWDRWSRDELVKNGTFDFLKYFDTGIFSCDVRCSKPDHKIYEKLFKETGVVPNATIFFDDNPDNIRASMEIGMYGILFNKDYTPQWICDMLLGGEPIEEMCASLQETTTYDIEKTKDTYMIKNEKGQVISKIKYFDYKMKNFNWVLITDVDTNPSYRKQGLASRLLNEVYKDVRKESNNTKGIYVFVKQDNTNAINLYKKLKFSIIKEYKLSDGDYFIMAKGSADKRQFDNMNFK